MSSKRQRGEGSSSVSSKSYDKKRFSSIEASDKYKALESRTFIPERGLLPDPDQDGQLAQMIAERGWFQFTAQPGEAIAPIVKEFYANLQERHLSEVYVRGQLVSIQSDAINAYFHLPNFIEDVDQHAQFISHGPNYELIIQELCQPETKWDIKGRGAMTFPQAALSPYGRAWYAFLCARLMPTNHFTHVTKDRAVLLYSLVKGNKMDVGAVIESSIKRYIRGGATTGGFPHPMLITSLCFNAGVRWPDNSETVQPWPVIDHALIKRYKGWKGAEQHPRGLGYIIVQQEEATPSNTQVYRQMRRIQKQMNEHHVELLNENTRLAERQQVLYSNFNQFQESLAEMFGRINPNAGPYQFPEPRPMPIFPPEESNTEAESANEESEDEDGGGN